MSYLVQFMFSLFLHFVFLSFIVSHARRERFQKLIHSLVFFFFSNVMFNAILVFLVFGFVPVNSRFWSLMPTQCNVMYKASCQQLRVAGDHDMICGNTPQYKYCQQVCHSANCRLRCNARITCQQQCAAGRCDVMMCTSGNCSQACIRGGCKMDCSGNVCQQHCYMGGCNMECSPAAERCFQSCEMGKCNMRCPAGVKECEQTCKGGRCVMICEAEGCKRSCEGGRCLYSTKVARESKDLAPRYCDSDGEGRNCLQACAEGRCKLKYKYSGHASMVQLCHGGNCEFDCKAPLKCTQICTGGRCRKYVCNSKLCIQECVAGGCLMECEAETCIQMCRGGDCSMNCFSNVNDCFQWCTGGNCILKCSAKHCNPFCADAAAKCITDGEGPRLKAMTRRVRCTMTTRKCEQVCPPKRSCAFMGWKHLHVFHSTNQVCDEGDCRQMMCYASKSCNQICNDGACGRMACKSNTCVQDCLGANCNMDCRARNCTQLCRGGGCKMTCSGNTEICTQLCNTRISDCLLTCFAKVCLIALP